MGEVAEILGENVSAVRYWSNYFEQYVKPARNAKGNRLFHPEDVETLQDILVAGVNEAIKKVESTNSEEMSAITSGMNLNIPGMF